MEKTLNLGSTTMAVYTLQELRTHYLIRLPDLVSQKS